MKKLTMIGVVALLLAVALPAMAGEKHKCTASAQDCLNKMNSKMQAKGWLGIETATTDSGHWEVAEVFPGSPAEKAGFKKGDVLLAVNGVEMSKENKEAYKKAAHKLSPGSEAHYVVKRQGGKVKLTAELESVPREVQAKWVGDHMIESHVEVQVASK
jgi:C-terminal processing protease CtpA/Prc